MTVAMPGSDSSMEQGPGYGGRTQHVAIAGPRSGLAVWTDQSHNRCVLRLSGRLCADTVSLLDSHVDFLGCRSCEEVVIDLQRIDHMDPVGARLIVGFGHYVAGRGGRFAVDGVRPTVRSMLAEAEVELS